eukprot:13781021-Heterocapsa_arctica.AAC.1
MPGFTSARQSSQASSSGYASVAPDLTSEFDLATHHRVETHEQTTRHARRPTWNHKRPDQAFTFRDGN